MKDKSLNKKIKALIELEIRSGDKMNPCNNFTEIIASALYVSAKGTVHFYEALSLLATLLPEQYEQEFKELKESYI